MTLAVGVDVGGTKIAAGVVETTTGRIVTRLRRPTPTEDGDAVAQAVVDVILELAHSNAVTAVGLGVPGFVSSDRTEIAFAPNLPLPTQPLLETVAAGTGLHTCLENDANAAAWGEYRFGAAVNYQNTLMVTVGTGIGGGLILGGQLYRGATGMAAEIGHMRLVPGGAACGCGQAGCWEMYGSGAVVTERARHAVRKADPNATILAELAGGSPDNVTGAMVTDSAKRGDQLARNILNDAGRRLGEGLASLAAVLDPGIIVVGGGLVDAGSWLLGSLRQSLEAGLAGRGIRRPPRVAVASLQEAGIVGAADLATVIQHKRT